jgi:hypothetical protein
VQRLINERFTDHIEENFDIDSDIHVDFCKAIKKAAEEVASESE